MFARALKLLTILSWLVLAGIAVQAVLAGQGWFQDQNLMSLHGGIGHGVLALAVATVGLALAARIGWGLVLLGGVLLLGLVGQTGLGYAGRRSGIALASSLHIPLGVGLFGLSVALALLITLRIGVRVAPEVDDAPA